MVSFPRCTTGLNIVVSCCIRLHTTANIHGTTLNILGATMLGVVASVCTQPYSGSYERSCSRSICTLEKDTSMASPTKLYKFGYNVFLNISHMKYCTDLILRKAFCIFICFHFPTISVLNCLQFYFGCCDSENRE